jgi:hypothetical protein
MRCRSNLLLAFVGSLGLSGCASAPVKWVSPDIGPMPRSLAVHMPPITVANPDDLREDLQIDSAEFAAWMRPHLATALKGVCGVDTIQWLDQLVLATDTIAMGKRRFYFERPADSLPYERVLVLSFASTERVKEMSVSTINGMQTGKLYLQMYSHYMLVDGRAKRDLAHGRAWSESKFLVYMDKSNWNEGARALSKSIASDLCKR